MKVIQNEKNATKKRQFFIAKGGGQGKITVRSYKKGAKNWIGGWQVELQSLIPQSSVIPVEHSCIFKIVGDIARKAGAPLF